MLLSPLECHAFHLEIRIIIATEYILVQQIHAWLVLLPRVALHPLLAQLLLFLLFVIVTLKTGEAVNDGGGAI